MLVHTGSASKPGGEFRDRVHDCGLQADPGDMLLLGAGSFRPERQRVCYRAYGKK